MPGVGKPFQQQLVLRCGTERLAKHPQSHRNHDIQLVMRRSRWQSKHCISYGQCDITTTADPDTDPDTHTNTATHTDTNTNSHANTASTSNSNAHCRPDNRTVRATSHTTLDHFNPGAGGMHSVGEPSQQPMEFRRSRERLANRQQF